MNLDEAFEQGGEAAVIRQLLTFDNPTEETFRVRWATLFSALQKEHPDFPKSGFAE